jgi:hypothetical protein
MADQGTNGWSKDVDATLATAKQREQPALLDFTAAPT